MIEAQNDGAQYPFGKLRFSANLMPRPDFAAGAGPGPLSNAFEGYRNENGLRDKEVDPGIVFARSRFSNGYGLDPDDDLSA
jgi:hypothetical protein